ncbi:MAG: ATP-binding protein [Lachnospira sp.]
MSERKIIEYKYDFETHYKDLSKICHEIINSVALINSSYQYIDARYPESHEFKFWNTLGNSVRDLTCLMKRTTLCRYSHFPNKEIISIGQIVNSALAKLEEYPDNSILNVISVNTNIDSNTPVLCDAEHTSQAMTELITNAYEAQLDTEQLDTDAQWIKVNISSKDDLLAITVTNPGSIDVNQLYQNLTNALYTTKDNHSGLGLFIVKATCSSHGGSLIIESDDDTTSATMTLSLKADQSV